MVGSKGQVHTKVVSDTKSTTLKPIIEAIRTMKRKRMLHMQKWPEILLRNCR